MSINWKNFGRGAAVVGLGIGAAVGAGVAGIGLASTIMANWTPLGTGAMTGGLLAFIGFSSAVHWISRADDAPELQQLREQVRNLQAEVEQPKYFALPEDVVALCQGATEMASDIGARMAALMERVDYIQKVARDMEETHATITRERDMYRDAAARADARAKRMLRAYNGDAKDEPTMPLGLVPAAVNDAAVDLDRVSGRIIPSDPEPSQVAKPGVTVTSSPLKATSAPAAAPPNDAYAPSRLRAIKPPPPERPAFFNLDRAEEDIGKVLRQANLARSETAFAAGAS